MRLGAKAALPLAKIGEVCAAAVTGRDSDDGQLRVYLIQ
jgi:hypothetical protein